VTAYPYAIFKDNTRWNFAAKKQAYTGVPNLTIVTPSHWLAGLVKQSFLQDYPVAVIPNGINLEQFAPSETPDGSAQEQPASAAMSGGKGTEQPAPGKKLVLGVANQWEERKGLPFFLWLVENLPENYVVELVGLNKRQYRRLKKQFPNERLIPITHTKNVQELAALYRAADVYVNATLEDNFPTTNLEALACGTPVITFATGGSVESVTDTCGVIVPKGDKRRLLEAVRNVAEKQPFRAEDCRAQALNYDRKDRYTEYVALYDRVRND
jgi:glycosyltransferase involved in cell wall biosynthesis